MKTKILLILLLLSISVIAKNQVVQQGQQQKVFISVGNRYGDDETNANCFITITNSQNAQLIDQSPMYYDGGSLYYFLTNKNWEIGSYTSSFTCTSTDGSESGIVNFNIEPHLEDFNEEQPREESETWFETLTDILPYGIGGFFKVLKSVFSIALDTVLFIPKFFVTLFGLFVWSIKNIVIILMLLEIYILSSAIAEKTLTGQISVFLQKNVYAIDFIITTSLRILTFGLRILLGLLTTISNLIPFT